ncbi:MAG: hypothetical protein PHH54_05160 [Candidatus Nanoarchaeia archaeon]|nr:hypothetical protein [Candidatus Nanoarchaeia archaeon]MDD5741347.1 hypothetical protein [Candidatus Nanoarchaeia archaeon]
MAKKQNILYVRERDNVLHFPSISDYRNDFTDKGSIMGYCLNTIKTEGNNLIPFNTLKDLKRAISSREKREDYLSAGIILPPLFINHDVKNYIKFYIQLEEVRQIIHPQNEISPKDKKVNKKIDKAYAQRRNLVAETKSREFESRRELLRFYEEHKQIGSEFLKEVLGVAGHNLVCLTIDNTIEIHSFDKEGKYSSRSFGFISPSAGLAEAVYGDDKLLQIAHGAKNVLEIGRKDCGWETNNPHILNRMQEPFDKGINRIENIIAKRESEKANALPVIKELIMKELTTPLKESVSVSEITRYITESLAA